MTNNTVSLVIIHYGSLDLTVKLLETLSTHRDQTLIDEVFVVNNDSPLEEDEYNRILDNYSKVRIIENDLQSYAGGINVGAEQATGDVLLFSNNDVMWSEDITIAPLVERLFNQDAGIVGPQLMYPDGSWQRSYGWIPSICTAILTVFFIDSIAHLLSKYRFDYDKQSSKKVGYIDGAFMAVTDECFREAGGFDERFRFYAEEADFCYRAHEQGWDPIFEPTARIIHLRGASSMDDEITKYSSILFDSKSKLVEKHHGTAHARIYENTFKLALKIRALVYQVLAQLVRSNEWNERAERARVRHNAVQSHTDE